MTDSPRKPADDLARAQFIDHLCNEFEAVWLAGRTPQIEDYLARATEADRDALARELLPLDQHHRRRRGEAVEPEMTAALATKSAGSNSLRSVEQRLGPPSQPAGSSSSAPSVSIGSCEVLQEIARGGMGVVFRGRDSDLRRDIAIKVLLERHQGEAELIRRFVEEAQISGQLQHPGITPVYELGEFPDGRPYFSMKLVRGETLAQLLVARAKPEDDRERFLTIFEQICQTLAYAHSRRVIHRDLKPANIMVGTFGEVQVMDWGLAKVLDEVDPSRTQPSDATVIRTARSDSPNASTGSGSHTQHGSVLGTLAYMPPEQALGEIDNLDRRADVFGLGAILCEILTGRPPYVANNFEQLRRKAVRADLAEAFERLDGCGADQELISLARRALASEPANRPAHAGELAQEIINYRGGVESRLRQAELAEAKAHAQADAERSRRKLTLMFAGALLTVLAVGVVGTTWGLFRAMDATSAANDSKESLRRQLYVADLQLANQMWERDSGTARNVAERLAAHVPGKGQADLREFAWRLQWTALNRNALVCQGHDQGARLVAFHPSGQLVTLDGELVLRRWNIPEGTRALEVKLPELPSILHWEISDDGQQIALGSGTQVHIFNTQSGDRTHTLPARPASALLLGLSFSAAGRHLACAWSDGRVQVWDPATGQESSSSVVKYSAEISLLERIQLTPDAKRVYLLNYPKGNQVTCLDIGQTESLDSAEHHSWVHSMAISPDGRLRATGDSNGQVCLSEGDAAHEPLRVHRGVVSAVGFSADGHRFATGCADGTITIWDVARREQLFILKGHQGRIQGLHFAADSLSLASASDDGAVRVWDLRSGDSSRVLGDHEQSVFSMSYSPDGARLAVGIGADSATSSAIVRIWDVATGRLVTEFPAADGRVLALAYSPDGRRLITGGYDSRLSVRDVATGSELYSRPERNSAAPRHDREAAIGTVAVSPDGQFVAAGFGHPTFHLPDYEQIAKVWNLATGEELATLHGHVNTICEVAFSHNGKFLATASDDHQVKLWSVEKWQLRGSLSGTTRLKSVAFSNDDQWIAVGDASGVVTIWETADGRGGRLVTKLRGHADAVQRLAISPDGKTLATASWDNTIKLWDPLSGREMRTLRDQENWISCLAFSPDGNTLATGSFDAKVRLWTATSEREIAKEIDEDQSRADRRAAKRDQQRQSRATRPHQMLSDDLLDRCVGTYDRKLIVQRQADHLLLHTLPGTQGQPVAFYPASETEFFCRDRPIDLMFLIGADATVKSILVSQNGAARESKRLASH